MESLFKIKNNKKIFKQPIDMPILEDLYNIFEKDNKCKIFKIKLMPFVKGSLNFFNHITNVNLNNNLIVADIYELGEEGRLLEMQLEELVGDLEEEELLIIKDYIAPGKKRTAEKVLEEIKALEYDDLMLQEKIAKALGYEDFDSYDEVAVYTRGYRVLNKIPRMPSNIVENLVKSFKSFQHILDADLQQLDDVDGIGEIRARTIKSSLKRMQEQFVFDNLIL